MNTEKGINAAALSALASNDMDNFIAASTEGGIEAQEAAGQASFVESQSLPKKCPKEDLEKLGFIFGDDVDDIFVSVQTPAGWSIEPTEHSMWNDLLDGQGRKRGSMFYKAAFYDRSAHMHLDKRFSCHKNYDLEDGQLQFKIMDGSKAIFKTDIESAEAHFEAYWALEDKLRKIAMDFLAENYPDHEDCNAYWS